MTHYSDIIKGVRKNETKSQIAFYDKFVRPVYQSAFGIVGNSEEAEEITQDTMIKVFSKTSLLLDDAVQMTRILRRIAVNQAIDTIRKRKDFIFSLEVETGDACEEEEELEAVEWDLDDIKEGINRLSPIYRSVISLRLFEEMGFAEIAAQLKINPSTVRVQYTRGITHLRNYLEQKKENDK
jgi:RNA polymerase sigma-70 factor (ECF subfamily)